MTDITMGSELAGSIMAAVTEAREHGASDDQIIDALADAIKGLLEMAGTVGRRHFESLPLRRSSLPRPRAYSAAGCAD